MYGELIPTGGGDIIPLLKDKLLIGRREGCDIVLDFTNVSGKHCRLEIKDGYWFVEDLGSSNGTKVNGNRVTRKRVDPGDILGVAKHFFTMQYVPAELGAMGAPPTDDEEFGALIKKSLLERAGVQRRDVADVTSHKTRDVDRGRFNVMDDDAGQVQRIRKERKDNDANS